MSDPIDPPSLLPSDTLEDASPMLRPQLRLHHFFAFTAAAAVIFALVGPAFTRPGQMEIPKFLAAISMGWSMLYAFVLAAAATAVFYGMIWHRRGVAFFDQPGHWLIVEIGVMGMLSLISYALIWRKTSDGGVFSSASFRMYQIYSLALVVTDLVFNIYIASKKCGERRWKVLFVIKGFSQLSRSFRLVPVGSILVLIALTIAVVRDRRFGVARDAGHWFGVAIQFATSFLNIGSAGIAALYMHFAR